MNSQVAVVASIFMVPGRALTCLEKKSPKRKRRMARPVEIAPSDTKTVRKLLGGGK